LIKVTVCTIYRSYIHYLCCAWHRL